MRVLIKTTTVMVLLSAVPLLAYCQYFQRLYDIDSSDDWGWNIAVKSDGNLFLEGEYGQVSRGIWGEFNLTVSGDGNSVLNKNI